MQRRLANAAAEIGYATERGGANFDAVLVNDDLEQCYAQLKAPFPPTHAADTLRKTYPRTHARRRSPFPGSKPATREDSACSAVRSCVALPSLHAPALLLRSRGTHAASRVVALGAAGCLPHCSEGGRGRELNDTPRGVLWPWRPAPLRRCSTAATTRAACPGSGRQQSAAPRPSRWRMRAAGE